MSTTTAENTPGAKPRLTAADVFTSNYRVRRQHREAVLDIARRAAVITRDWEVGDHRFSWTDWAWHFLDGVIEDRHEWYVGGLWVRGHQVRRYVLYALRAEQPPRWRGETHVPSFAELKRALKAQQQDARAAAAEQLVPPTTR
ncbi:MAG TPA: hypothetical protein VGE02_10190 [Gemmatimonadales bacterium]